LDVHDEQSDAGGGGLGHAWQTARKGPISQPQTTVNGVARPAPPDFS
jgi:hypothetical protein